MEKFEGNGISLLTMGARVWSFLYFQLHVQPSPLPVFYIFVCVRKAFFKYYEAIQWLKNNFVCLILKDSWLLIHSPLPHQPYLLGQ
jgi:hypothetical protein